MSFLYVINIKLLVKHFRLFGVLSCNISCVFHPCNTSEFRLAPFQVFDSHTWQVAVILHCAELLETPWTKAGQASPPTEFSRPEHWSGLSFPPLEYLSHPGMEPESLVLQADSLPSEPPGKPNEWQGSKQFC